MIVTLQDGDTCPRDGCTGELMWVPDGDCSCAMSAHPPCLACENAKLVCVACGEVAP